MLSDGSEFSTLFDSLRLSLTRGDNDNSNVRLLDVDPVSVVPETWRVTRPVFVSFAWMLFDWLGLSLTSGDNDNSIVRLLDVDPVSVVPETWRVTCPVSVSFA